jgi:hypothetical protein
VSRITRRFLKLGKGMGSKHWKKFQFGQEDHHLEFFKINKGCGAGEGLYRSDA